MPIEDRIRETLETVATRMRRDLDGHLDTVLADLARLLHDSEEASRAESERAVKDARVEAEHAVNDARNEAERAMKAVRDEAERAAKDARVEAERMVKAARAEAERTVNDARVEAERGFHTRLEGQRVDLSRDWEARLSSDRAELEAAMAAAKLEMHGHHVDSFGRLLGTFRRLEEVTSLSSILETLAQAAAVEAKRVAVLIVDKDTLRNWGHFGFSHGQGPVDIPIAEAGLLGEALSAKRTSVVPNPIEGQNPVHPEFLRVPIGEIGMVGPIVVGGEVVALLYADGPDRRPNQPDAGSTAIWAEKVELLVRHAALRLENVASVRTVQILTRPV